jgi:hypothetical protein
MFDTIIERLMSYWETFSNSPLEIQVVLGAASMVVAGATRKVWKGLFPVRWLAAKAMVLSSYIFYKPKKNPVEKNWRNIKAPPAILLDTKENLLKTLKFYNHKKRVKLLSDNDIRLIEDVCDEWYSLIPNNRSNMIKKEREERHTIKASQKIIKAYGACVTGESTPRVDDVNVPEALKTNKTTNIW